MKTSILNIITLILILLTINRVNAQWSGSSPNIYPTIITDKVGIGVWSPANLLQQHITGNSANWHQFTNGNTGSNNDSLGFQVGIRYDNTTTRSIAELRHWLNAPMIFYTQDSTKNAERIRISYGRGGDGSGYLPSYLHFIREMKV